MKKFLNIILILIVFLLISLNTSFALDETSYINWNNESISRLYSEDTKKLTFLLQYKVKSEPNIDYQYYLKITTSERKRICEGSFIYNGINSIYTICSLYIDDINALDEEINLIFEVENPDIDEYEVEIKRNFNILKNIKTFDWILDVNDGETIDIDSEVIDLDILDTDEDIVEQLHKNGKTVIGYINVGAIENYRDDYNLFPSGVVGKTYPLGDDERFLDIRNYDKFKHLILNRLDIAKEKGFDGIEVDNMDTYDNYSETGFNILRGDMEEYLIWLSLEAKMRGMFLIQKNAPELSKKMEKYFDGALLEGAFYNNFESEFSNYIKEDKVVINTEYTDNTSEEYFLENICPKSKELGFISILKNRNLDEYIFTCYEEKNDFILNIKTKENIDKILYSFYENLNNIYSKKNDEKVKVLEEIILKIVILKNKEDIDIKKLATLEYIEKNILNKIFWYNYQIWEDSL